MHHIAILASGKGSNAENLCRYFKEHSQIRVSLILSDRKNAGVFDVAEKNAVPAIYLSPDLLKNPSEIINLLKVHTIDFIVLAGYLKLIPSDLVKAFEGRMINLHPALLPKFGGKGMFGMHVHNAVVESAETETGISIHYVNDHYDKGDMILQASVAVEKEDSPQRIAEKISKLEMYHLPRVIEQLLIA